MRGHALRFYATCKDLCDALDDVSSRIELKYIQAGMHDHYPDEFLDHRQVKSFGVAITGDQVLEPSFLIVRLEERVQPRIVPQRRGGTLIAIDQSENPRSVVFRPGGEYGDGGVIVAGELSTVSDDQASIELWKQISKDLKRLWKKIKAYYVSPHALTVLRQGGRLTVGVKRPKEYDLREEP
ncbi:hypothetical protein [Dyadobacter sp. 676]|uniref:Uncharacterized protein n=1 Tax=Dyadobacter sp. 676 TaxID=3088362 RepID=A0AAU8FEM6_9BACT